MHAYKHQEFLQVHNFFFGGCGIFKNRPRGPAIISSCFPSNFASYLFNYIPPEEISEDNVVEGVL